MSELSKQDIEVASEVVRRFLKSKEATPKMTILMMVKKREALDRLTRWSILSTADYKNYLPRALAFHYCGDQEALSKAKRSLGLVACLLKELLEHWQQEDRQYSFEEIAIHAREKHNVVDPELIKLGLYFGSEYGFLAGWSHEITEPTNILISVSILEMEHPENLWDEFIERQIGWIKGQINGAAGLAAESEPTIEDSRRISKKIFLVHGHDDEIKEGVSEFLKQLGLDVVILHQQPNRGRTIVEKFEEHSDVTFAVVLLTPDDIGADVKRPDEMNKRPRQNVILELGSLLSKLAGIEA